MSAPGLSPTPYPLPLTRADLAAMGLRGLHCGSGRTLHRGFLNSDVMQLSDGQGGTSQLGQVCCFNQLLYYLQHDQTTPLPIEAESFDWVFSEHFIEHISVEQAVAWMREVHRVLKPGGIVRISTPDLALYANGYGDPHQTFYRRHHNQLHQMGMTGAPCRPAWMLNQIFRNYGHQWIYDLDELTLVARSAGFDPELVQRCSYRHGAVPELAQLDQEMRSDESLYVELRKRGKPAASGSIEALQQPLAIQQSPAASQPLPLRGLKPLQQPVAPDAVSLFAVIGDEPYFLPHFLRHYRQLGIDTFTLYLDRPNPQTLQFLENQSDVELLTSDLPFGTNFGKHRNGALIRLHHLLRDQFTEKHFAGRRTLTVDADEFAVLPSNFESIHEFCKTLDEHNLVHSSAPMIDFYPKKLNERDFDPRLTPFEKCSYFDKGPYYFWEPPALSPKPVYSGIRERITRHLALNHPDEWQQVIGPDYAYKPPKIWKVPLLKHGCGVERILTHEASQTPSAHINLALAHFKYHPGVDKKVSQAIGRAEYYRGALEYKIMNLAFQRMGDLDLTQDPHCRTWQGPASLERAELLINKL